MQHRLGWAKNMIPNAQKILGNDENRASQGFDDRRLLGIVPFRRLLILEPFSLRDRV
jgi:hypothetical protein